MQEILKRCREANIPIEKDAAGNAKSPAGNLIGLALSGGGVRSASFNLGLLQSLYENGVLRHVDYMSTNERLRSYRYVSPLPLCVMLFPPIQQCELVFAAAFDVFTFEPSNNDALIRLENFIATPHIGSGSIEARLKMGIAAIAGLKDNFVPSRGTYPFND